MKINWKKKSLLVIVMVAVLIAIFSIRSHNRRTENWMKTMGERLDEVFTNGGAAKVGKNTYGTSSDLRTNSGTDNVTNLDTGGDHSK